jgi:hypothetical protein
VQLTHNAGINQQLQQVITLPGAQMLLCFLQHQKAQVHRKQALEIIKGHMPTPEPVLFSQASLDRIAHDRRLRQVQNAEQLACIKERQFNFCKAVHHSYASLCADGVMEQEFIQKLKEKYVGILDTYATV